MISGLVIESFKCFEKREVELAPLTIFCGSNAVGKSTVLQAIYIARQSLLRSNDEMAFDLNVNGGLELGTVGDLYSNFSDSDSIKITLMMPDQPSLSIQYRATAKDLDSRHLSVENQTGDARENLLSQAPSAFTYLLADRVGPADTYLRRSMLVEDIHVGLRGEYTAQILLEHEQLEVEAAIRSLETKASALRSQVEAWMKQIITGVQLLPAGHAGTNVCSIQVRRSSIEEEWRKLANFGFGVTYSLPILVGALSSARGSLMMVDSPEAHLHPRSQSQIAQFLAKCASSGRQVLVETHSDHVINGVRLAVAGGALRSEDVVIYNCALEDDGRGSLKRIKLSDDGSLEEWPRGFFDQIQSDLRSLVNRKRVGRA